MDQPVNIAPVAVLLPVYNAQAYLKEAMESILNQTYSDFDFYIINDGSTDASEQIILSYSDERIKYIKNEGNKGLIYTLNEGLELIPNTYVLRMDADDVAQPERISRQLAFMEAHPEVIVSGTQIRYFGNVNHDSDFPLTHELIHAHFLFGSAMVHPSVIIRMDAFRKQSFFYDKEYLHMEDYELWTRVAKAGKLANINDVLLHYRMEGQNITVTNWNSREERLVKISTKLMQELEIATDKENIRLHIELSGNTKEIADLSKLKKYAALLISQNDKKLVYDAVALKKIIDEYWRKLFFKSADRSLSKAFFYWKVTGTVSWSQLKYMAGKYRRKMFK